MNTPVPFCSPLRFGRIPSHCYLLVVLLLLGGSLDVRAQRSEPNVDPEGQIQRLDSALRSGIERYKGEEEEDVSGRMEWFEFQRRYPFDMIPAGVRADAIRQVQRFQDRMDEAKAKRGASPQAANRWEQIGPYNIAGRVKAIAADPNKPGLIFVGAAAGGVWKNEGDPKVWSTTFDHQTAIAVNALDIDTEGKVWAGTGEIFGPNSNPSASLAYLGDGIFMSSDEGATWKNMGLRNVGAFSKIFVHRQNPQIIYATAMVANSGFYRSTDGGQTWSTASPSGTVNDLSVNPHNSNTLYIATPSSIRRSTDAGKTFTNVTGSGMSGIRMSVALAPSDTNIIYAMVAKGGGPNGYNLCEVYRSTNRGDSWTKVPDHASFTDGTFFRDQGFYNMCLAVYPEDPNIVLAGGIDVYQTVDGGQSWVNTTKSYQGGSVHADQHILRFDPASGVVYLGDDGGVYRSFDRGSNWERLSNGLPISQFYSIDVDQTRDYRAFGGTQDNGTLGSVGSSLAWPTDWSRILGGDGFHTVVDKTDPTILYGEVYYGQMSRASGSNYTSTRGISGNIPSTDDGIWSTPMAQSPADKTTLYSGRSSLYRTLNPRASNPTWQTLTPGNNNKMSAIGLSPFDAGVMIVGTISGDLRYSTDNGSTWKASTGHARRFITDLVYDPVDANRVYVTVSGTDQDHVYRSDDKGATFANVSGNLPRSLPVNAIEIDPDNNKHIFVGTDAGAYATIDGGEFWFPFNNGLPYAPVNDLKIHRSSRMLIAGTHGRSMFRVSIDNIEPPAILLAPVGGESYGSPGAITVRWGGFDGPVRVKLSFDGGASFPIVKENIVGDSTVLEIGFVKTDNAKVRVESMDGSVAVGSGAFRINPSPNVVELGSRGLHSEAIEFRRGQIWATQQNSDTIVKLRVPALSPLTKEILKMTGITGTVRDMAYDSVADMFYMLVANADYSDAKVFRMDTMGVAQGELTLPATSISGITVVSDGLALITPGLHGRIYVIDPSSGTVVSESLPLENGRGSMRAGLIYDNLGFEQAVSDANGLPGFESELQRIKGVDTVRAIQFTPVVIGAGGSLVFFGLAYDPNLSDTTQRAYYATDTAGAIYRIPVANFFAGVKENARVESASSISIHVVTPNPFRTSATIEYESRTRQHVSVELIAGTGGRVAQVYDGNVDVGSHTLTLDARDLSSGIYYVSIDNGAGERVVHPVVVMK